MNTANWFEAIPTHALEALIETCRGIGVDLRHSKTARAAAFNLMRALVEERSRETVRRMEIERFGQAF